MSRAQQDPYAVLGTARTCSDRELRKAYLRLAQQHHPDRHRDADAAQRTHHEQRMLAVNAAWSLVDTKAKRRAHDRGETDARPSATRPTDPTTERPPRPAGGRRPDEDGEQLRDWRSYAVAGSSGSVTRWQLLTFVPPGLGLAAVLCFGFGMLLRTNFFMPIAVVCASFAVVSFLALALLRMTRGVQADRVEEKRRSY